MLCVFIDFRGVGGLWHHAVAREPELHSPLAHAVLDREQRGVTLLLDLRPE